jgi:hypothetical protein
LIDDATPSEEIKASLKEAAQKQGKPILENGIIPFAYFVEAAKISCSFAMPHLEEGRAKRVTKRREFV